MSQEAIATGGGLAIVATGILVVSIAIIAGLGILGLAISAAGGSRTPTAPALAIPQAKHWQDAIPIAQARLATIDDGREPFSTAT